MSLPALAGELEPGEMSHLTGVLNQPESLQNAEEAMGDYIEIIETEAAKRAGDGRARPPSGDAGEIPREKRVRRMHP